MNGSSLPISNDRRSSRPGALGLGSLNLSGNMGGMGLPLPVPVPMPPLPPNKRPRLDDLAPQGLAYPYRLDVDLNTYPPTAMASSLPSSQHQQQQQQQQSHMSNNSMSNGSNMNGSMNGSHSGNGNGGGNGGLSGLFGAGGGLGGGYLPQPSFDFQRRAMGFAGAAPGYASQGQMFQGRPGPTSANMLVDLLNASNESLQAQQQQNGNSNNGNGANNGGGGGANGFAFDWPVHSSSGAQEGTLSINAGVGSTHSL